ncbi:MAG: tape measure protein [Sphingomonas paucimobilis]
MPALDPLIFDLQVRYRDLEQNTRNASRLFTTETDRMKRASADLTARLQRDSGAIAGSIKGLAGSFAAYFSGKELVGLIDGFTRLQNSLRVAGLEGAALDAAQKRLFASAQKYGVEIGGLTSLFGTLTQASKELGVTQADVFKVTDTVSASLKITGATAEQAGGALLQLGQALRGGKVQAEEYNSLLDGLYPLLEAAATGSDRFGGSVAKLTTAVKDGKVSSKEFFDAIVQGSTAIEAKAARAADTIAGGYTRITNALTIYVGESAKANGATGALVGAMDLLADNIDVIIPALGILGAALGVGLVTNALRAQGSVAGLGASILAAFGGGVGLAITGVTLALTAYAAESAETSRLVDQARDANTRYQDSLKAAQIAAQGAASGQAAVGDQSAAAVPKIDAFAGATGRAAAQLYKLAQAQKAAAIEGLKAKKIATETRLDELAKRTPAGRGATGQRNREALSRGDLLGLDFSNVTAGARNLFSNGRADREVATAIQQTIAERDRIAKQIADTQGRPLEKFAPPAVTATPGGGKPAKTAKGSAAPKGKTAEQLADEQQRIAQEIANANIAYLRQLEGAATSAEERLRLEQAAIEASRVANNQEIANDQRYNAAQRLELQGLNDKIAASQKSEADRRETERLRLQQLDIVQNALRDEDASLQIQSRLTGSIAIRNDIERRRLKLAYDMERAALAEELAQAGIAKDTKRIADVQRRIADLNERETLDKKVLDREQEGPLDKFRSDLKDARANIGDSIEQAQVSALQTLNNGLVEAITNSKSLGDVFSNVASSIVQDLVRIAVQQAIIVPLLNALGGGIGSLFTGGGGFNPFGRASGGYVGPGQTVRVNEQRGGVELLRMGSQGGTVIPLGQVNASANPRQAPMQPVIIQLSADEGAMFVPRVEQISGSTAVQVVRAAAPSIMKATSVQTRADARRDARFKL